MAFLLIPASRMAVFTARCIRNSSTCQRPSWPVNSFFQRFLCGKSLCHLSSCCLKDILSQGHWEGLRLQILRPNPSGEFFWVPQSVFRFAVTDYMCLIQDAFPGIFFWIAIQALLFYFERELHFSQKKEDCLKKTALVDFFWRFLLTSWDLICVMLFAKNKVYREFWLTFFIRTNVEF